MKRNNLDEMQELKLLKIEQKGFKIVFYGLVVLIVIESFMTGFSDIMVILDKVVLALTVALFMIVSCLKAGIWDRYVDASNKNILLISTVLGICGAGVLGYKAYITDSNVVYSTLLGFVIAFVFSFILSMLIRYICFKRIDVLENGDDE